MSKGTTTRNAIIAIAVLVILLIAGFVWLSSRESAVTFKEVSVTRGNIAHTILSSGFVQPRNRLQIKAPVAGRIEQILVKEGQVVKKGDVMAWMSSTERAALLDAAAGQGPEVYKKWAELYLATPVLAPIEGTVIQKNVEPGQTFASSDAIFQLSDQLTVKAQVDETDISRIKLKEPAVITLDAYPDEKLPAFVDKIAFDSTTVNSVTTFVVDVIPQKTPTFMRSGMTANVTFSVDLRSDVLLMPSEALKVVDGKTVVLLKSPETNKPETHRIEVGITDGKMTEVLSGLKEGDVLMISEFKLGDRKSNNSPFGMPGSPARKSNKRP
ncbi:macrolide transporter [Bdellovibrio bacteriovorus]|uniref:Macrolide transporter n=1 Tax=Bdellovibrio bacteriovorus TaxID=959 RepID=A0A150WS48_BDEBC|nr:HlyD family efflux transporter periplasmic adaptor subunit [Bdellovibrio bacteriovorus]KYG67260.1 macrolide transporter [Bdellovibrio bacteriovorus]